MKYGERSGLSRRRHERTLALESLDERITPAVTGNFAGGVLSIYGDAGNNTIEVMRNSSGRILIGNANVVIRGGTPTVANTTHMKVYGLAGNDTIRLNETRGLLPKATLFGGPGHDTLRGGSRNDVLFGSDGNDILFGMGGVDTLFGGAHNDLLNAGVGNDGVFGQSGHDRLVWNSGDGTDIMEGGEGIDNVAVNGGNGRESFAVTPNGPQVLLNGITPTPFLLYIITSENLILHANGGNDTFTGADGLATLIQLTIDGGAGNDSLLGGDGADVLLGGDGDDLVDGNWGDDIAFLGTGNDTFQWDEGDGSDVVEGQDGTDRLQFSGSNYTENYDISANGERLHILRDVASIVMDCDDVEKVNVATLGGADTIALSELTRTDIREVHFDLGNLGVGDGQTDRLTLHGATGADQISINGKGRSYLEPRDKTDLVLRNEVGAA